MRKTVCFDFDGVLAKYDGWKGEDQLGDPIPGMKIACELLHDHGYALVVHTTRDPERVRRWLEGWGFPPLIQVSREKPPALCYVDDRALRFDGPPVDVAKLVETIEAYTTYWER